MKIRTFLITCTLAILFSNCKKETSNSSEKTSEPVVPSNFLVEMTVTAAKDDNFAVYFTEDGTIDFTGDNTVWSGVSASDNPQKVLFHFSEGVIPTHIRFDFGINKEQGNIKLSDVKLKFGDKSFEFKGSDFFTYFIENETIKTEIDDSAGTITFLSTSGEFATPFYYPHQAILDEITRITQ